MKRSESQEAVLAASDIALATEGLQGQDISAAVPDGQYAGDDDDVSSEASSVSGELPEPANGAYSSSASQGIAETFTIEGKDAPAEQEDLSLSTTLPDPEDTPPVAAPTTEGSLSLLRTTSSLTHASCHTPHPPSATDTAPDAVQPAADATENDEAWKRHSKHFFILTSSGKPVYTYHGDADSLAGLMALITALVSVVQAHGDKVHHITTGGMVVLFLLHGPLILVAVSKVGEHVDVLQRQLELLYRQILLVVTTGLERILLRNPAYDVRSLLEGVGSVLGCLVSKLCGDAGYLLPGVKPVPMAAQEKLVWSQALAEAVKSSGALYGVIMVAGGRVVAIEYDAGAKGLARLDPADLLVLDTFVTSNTSIRQQQGEAFCPLCLPAYNPAAFLHTYLHFLTPVDEVGLYLALMAPSAEQFHSMSRAREQLEGRLHQSGALQQLQRGLQPNGLAWTRVDRLPVTAGGGKLGTTALWHFMARFTHRKQVVVCDHGPMWPSALSRSQLAISYGQLHSLVMDYPPGGRPNKLVWLQQERHVMLAVLDSEVELYLVLDPLCDKATALRCAEQLRRHLGLRTTQAELLLPGLP